MKDIYFTKEYGVLYEKLEGGKCIEFITEREYGVIRYIFIKREIPIKIEGETYYDITTPYGYGGPIIENVIDEYRETLIEDFQVEFKKYCNENKIVSEFVRFHPLIENHKIFKKKINIEHNRDTIAIELESKLKIWENIHSKCRNMIRKAEKNQIKIDIKNLVITSDIEKFYELYIQTMIKNNAKEYYLFKKEFFIKNFLVLKNYIKIVNAEYEGKVISSAIILSYDKYLHYYFSGSDIEYRDLAATNLLLYKVAIYGFENGFQYFHLGGGYKESEDSLFKFKKSFNKNQNLEFYIGKKIHNNEIYIKLIEESNKDTDKILNNNYFPLYRS